MKLGIQIGVMAQEWKDKGGTSEHQPCDGAIEMAGSLGLRGLEVFERHIMAYYDKPDYMEEQLDKAGIILSGVYFPMDNALVGEGAQALADAKKASAFISEIGGHYLVLNGGPKKQEAQEFGAADFSQVARIANAIGDIASSDGISAVMHPHFGFMVETNANLESVLDAGLDPDKVGLCVHASHQVLAASDPYVMYERHADIVRYVHVGNGRAEDGKHIGTYLGDGDLDQKRLMNPLLESGFDGWVVIECSQDGASTKDYVNNTSEYLGTAFPGISWE